MAHNQSGQLNTGNSFAGISPDGIETQSMLLRTFVLCLLSAINLLLICP